jgi:tight adherence protein B
MRRRDRARARTQVLVDTLGAVADTMRGGSSLRTALTEAGRDASSPFHPVHLALEEGGPLVPTLHVAAQDGDDPDVASACCVLAVHAEAGGDPLPAVRSLADRIAVRQRTRDEARALTTQARLGARTILMLTPVFLLLVGITDPEGAVGLFADPRARSALVAGLVLQAIGGWWIGTIITVAGGGTSRLARVRFVRAIPAMLAGRPRGSADEEVAWGAELVALLLDAGVSATAAVSSAAPYVRGAFGEALRAGVAMTHTPLATALSETMANQGPTADRFARGIATSMELGVPLAPVLRGLSEQIRADQRLQASESIRRASIRVLVPLGALVLPAFVLACLVPLFAGGLDALSGQ